MRRLFLPSFLLFSCSPDPLRESGPGAPPTPGTTSQPVFEAALDGSSAQVSSGDLAIGWSFDLDVPDEPTLVASGHQEHHGPDTTLTWDFEPDSIAFTLTLHEPSVGPFPVITGTVDSPVPAERIPGGWLWTLDEDDQISITDPIAWDDGGRPVQVDLVVTGDHFSLLVVDTGARYPITIDPVLSANPVLISEDLAPLQPDGRQSNGDVVFDPANDVWISVWTGEGDEPGMVDGEQEVYARAMDADGAPVGPATRLTDLGPVGSASYPPRQASISRDPTTGVFLISWHVETPGSGWTLQTQRFTWDPAAGFTALAGPASVSPPAGWVGPLVSSDHIGRQQGGFLVAFIVQGGILGTVVIDADGVEQISTDIGNGSNVPPRLSGPTSAGAYQVLVQQGDASVGFHHVSPNGEALDEVVAHPGSDVLTGADIAWNPVSQSTLVAWSEFSSAWVYSTWTRRFDADGVAMGPASEVISTGVDEPIAHHVEPLPSGGWLLLVDAYTPAFELQAMAVEVEADGAVGAGTTLSDADWAVGDVRGAVDPATGIVGVTWTNYGPYPLLDREIGFQRWVASFDQDGDGHAVEPIGDDCDDLSAHVHPDADEITGNGVDEDCDGRDSWLGPDIWRPDRLVISEVMHSPLSGDATWFEILVTDGCVDPVGVEISGDVELVVGPGHLWCTGDYIVVADSDTANVVPDLVWTTGGLASTGSITISYDGDALGGLSWGDHHPSAEGASLNLWLFNLYSNFDPGNWCNAVQPFGASGSFGTPGAMNDDCVQSRTFAFDYAMHDGSHVTGHTTLDMLPDGTFSTGNGGEGTFTRTTDAAGQTLTWAYTGTGVTYTATRPFGEALWCDGVMANLPAAAVSGSWSEVGCP